MVSAEELIGYIKNVNGLIDNGRPASKPPKSEHPILSEMDGVQPIPESERTRQIGPKNRQEDGSPIPGQEDS